jgi:hypothetical protein
MVIAILAALSVPPLVLLMRQYLRPRTGPAGKPSRASFAAASAARPK